VLYGVRRSGFTQIEFVFQLPQDLVADLTFISQANCGLSFHAKQLARNIKQATVDLGASIVSLG
jgi:hypothetical protein